MARNTRNTAGRGDSNGGGASAPTTGGSVATGGGASNGGGASASTTGHSAATGAPGADEVAISQLSDAIQAVLDDVIPGDGADGISALDTKAYIKVLHRIGFDKQAVKSLLSFGIQTPGDLAAKSTTDIGSMVSSILR